MSETIRRVRPLAIALAAMTLLSLLGAVLLTGVMNRSLPEPEPFIIQVDPQSANSSDSGVEPMEGTIAIPRRASDPNGLLTGVRGVFVLFADRASPRLSGRLLAAAMADVGYAAVVLPVSADHFDQVPLKRVLDWVETRTGIQAEDVVAAGQGGIAAGLTAAFLDASPEYRPRQLVLISPSETGTQLTSGLAALPRTVVMTLIVGHETSLVSKAREYFLIASGEEAALIPGLRGTHELSAERILSADGQRRLVILPAFSKLNEGWSPRLHQTLQETLAAGANDPAIQPAPVRTLYNRLLMPIWTLMLLMLVPLLLTMTRSVMAAAAYRSAKMTDAPQRSQPGNWLVLLLYLPAAAVAIPAGRWLASLATDARLAEGFGFYALIGIHGWLLLLIHRFWTPAAQRSSPRPGFQAVAAGRTILFAILFLTAVFFWMTTVYGPGLMRDRLNPMIVPVALLLAPSMLSACIGYRRTRQRQRLFHTLAYLTVPALYLGVMAFVLDRATLAGAVGGILFLIVGRVVAKALSWDPAPQLIASAAGAWLMLMVWPLPLL